MSDPPAPREPIALHEARALLRLAREKYVPHPHLPEIARTIPPYVPPGPDCVERPGIPPTQCAAYRDHADWLPPAFVQNATCACETTPDEGSANAVRLTLQTELAATDEAFRAQCRDARSQLGEVEYLEWVAVNFAPVAYEWHLRAYATGCCPCGPAPFIDWVAVCTIPIPFCKLVEEAIDWFGSCHCTPGRW
jgi:hypothetical protein